MPQFLVGASWQVLGLRRMQPEKGEIILLLFKTPGSAFNQIYNFIFKLPG